MKVTSSPRKSDAAGDWQSAGALEEAFARFQSELLGTLFYLVGNLDDAHDAVQETFIKCWRHRGELDAIENLKAWIFRIALNTGRDVRASAWRRRRNSLSGDEAMLATRQPTPQANLEHQEEISLLRAALSDLRPEEQEVFLLRQNGDMTYDQIAVSVGIPLGTVKTRMRLALEKLRLALATT